MAVKKDRYYLIHDYNAAYDPKLVQIRQKYGAEGYGIYWLLVEWLRQQKDGKIKQEDIEAFTFNYQVCRETTEAVINDYDLFTVADGYVFSARLNRDTEAYNSLKQKRIDAGRTGGKASVKQRLSKDVTNVDDCSSSRVDKSREDKKEETTFSPDSDEMKFSHELHDRIRENNEKTKEPNWQQWSKELDLMFRLDGHTKHEIADVIVWSQQSSFWKNNILSPAKLRKQFATLYGQMKEDKNWQGQADKNGNTPTGKKGQFTDKHGQLRNPDGTCYNPCAM